MFSFNVQLFSVETSTKGWLIMYDFIYYICFSALSSLLEMGGFNVEKGYDFLMFKDTGSASGIKIYQDKFFVTNNKCEINLLSIIILASSY